MDDQILAPVTNQQMVPPAPTQTLVHVHNDSDAMANALVAITQQKSIGVAILLTLLFGPLGMCYSTIAGGIIMFFVNVVTLVFATLTLGIGLILWVLIWPIQIVWTVMAIDSHNKTVLARMHRQRARRY